MRSVPWLRAFLLASSFSISSSITISVEWKDANFRTERDELLKQSPIFSFPLPIHCFVLFSRVCARKCAKYEHRRVGGVTRVRQELVKTSVGLGFHSYPLFPGEMCLVIEAICHSPLFSHPPPAQKTWAYSALLFCSWQNWQLFNPIEMWLTQVKGGLFLGMTGASKAEASKASVSLSVFLPTLRKPHREWDSVLAWEGGN